MNRPQTIAVFAALLMLVAAGSSCSGEGADGSFYGDDVLLVQGTVRALFCFTIKADDGETYQVSNLPVAFQQEGLRVEALLLLRYDLVSGCMVGQIAEVLEIDAL